MLDMLEMLTIGFVIGMTGAIVPGPMLFATIDGSLKTGWKAGPEVVVGHASLELAICILVILGITAVSDSILMTISLFGGIILVVFGMLTIRNAGLSESSVKSYSPVKVNNFSAGFITSAANPYFWIWWLAAGSALVLRGLEISLLAAIMFIVGHWLADIGYFTAVSASFSKGKKLMSTKTYERVLVSCGLFLIIFGMWFIAGIVI